MAGKMEWGGAGAAELRGRLERWRRERDSRNMPEELWRSAALLAESEGVSAVSRALGLNYGNLKRRVRESQGRGERGPEAQPMFVELPIARAAARWGCVLEIEDGQGWRMRVRVDERAPMELAALGGALWKACR